MRTVDRAATGAPQPRRRRECPANWAVTDVDDWSARPRRWLANTGLDAWVVQRELADPISYVSLWLADAGESPERIATRGREWLDYFADAGIVAVGMGVLTLRRPSVGGAVRFQIVEEITGAGEEVTGDEAQAFLARQDFLAENSDEDLLAMRLSTSPVMLEEHLLPGDDGWQCVGRCQAVPAAPVQRFRSTRCRVPCSPVVGAGGARRPDRPARRPPRRRCRCARTGCHARRARGHRPWNRLSGGVRRQPAEQDHR